MKKITYIFVFFLCTLFSTNFTFASGWVTADNGNFYLNGAKWFPYGMNYWPSHFSHIIEPNSIESWYKSPYYENNSAIIDADLAKIQELGFNTILVSAYSSTKIAKADPNLVDFLQRVNSHNLKAGISLYVCDPFLVGHRKLCHDMIKSLSDYGITTDDTVFAYDIAPEVVVWQYPARNNFNRQWTEWIINQYTNFGNAENSWGRTLNRNCAAADSVLVSQNIPKKMIPGKTYNAQVTFMNAGSIAWTKNSNYRLGAIQDTEKFASIRYELGSTETINPGQSKTFNFTITAPSTVGTYLVNFKMLQENILWFGEELSQEVTVGNDELQEVVNYSTDLVCGPSDTELCGDSSSNKMVAAYRRFIDDYSNKEFGVMIRDIKKYDSKHLITVKMGFGGNGNKNVCPILPLDIRTSTNYLDFISYESWNYSPEKDNIKKVGFITNYAGVNKPVIDLEYGACGCAIGTDCTNCMNTDGSLEQQKEVYKQTYDMLKESGARGSFGWWFKGIRPNEHSDYWIITDDGNMTEKPVSSTIRSYATQMKNLPDRTPNFRITTDRDSHAGERQLYETWMKSYIEALNTGKTPWVKTVCSDTNSSSNTSLDWVLSKCMNSLFDKLQIKNSSGVWVDLVNWSIVKVTYWSPIYIRASVSNTGEATWLSHISANNGNGAVRLAGKDDEGLSFRKDISNNISWTKPYDFGEFSFSNWITKQEKVAFQMVSELVTWFGEKITVTLQPERDTTPPNTIINSSPESSTNKTTATFIFSASEKSIFKCKLDTETYETCLSPKNYTNLSVGNHTFSVKATDNAWNEDLSPANYTWTVLWTTTTTTTWTTTSINNTDIYISDKEKLQLDKILNKFYKNIIIKYNNNNDRIKSVNSIIKKLEELKIRHQDKEAIIQYLIDKLNRFIGKK